MGGHRRRYGGWHSRIESLQVLSTLDFWLGLGLWQKQSFKHFLLQRVSRSVHLSSLISNIRTIVRTLPPELCWSQHQQCWSGGSWSGRIRYVAVIKTIFISWRCQINGGSRLRRRWLWRRPRESCCSRTSLPKETWIWMSSTTPPTSSHEPCHFISYCDRLKIDCIKVKTYLLTNFINLQTDHGKEEKRKSSAEE